MKENRCRKKFPKRYNDATYFDKDGYAHYRRRETGVYTTKRGAYLDNCYTVPYNRTDRIVAQITRPVGEPPPQNDRAEIQIDEIYNFVDCRYICPYEVFWRILKFEIHNRQPAVQIMSVHLENMHVITFRYRQPLPQRRAGQGSIGRLAHVHPSSGELIYLRILLCHQKGCKSFEDIKTVNHRLYPTICAACEALGLLGDNKEWDTALLEACFSATPTELRNLFVQLLIFCEVSDPTKLWHKYWQRTSDDIPLRASKEHRIPNLHINNPELEQYALFELEIILKTFLKTLADFGLPTLSRRLLAELRNMELIQERSYNRDELAQEITVLVPKLNADQKNIYDLIMDVATNNRQELIFIYGHGGTGKTFLWKTIINTLRSQGKIVLAIA
ncbi:DNA helicase [Tanacetum coccineum]